MARRREPGRAAVALLLPLVVAGCGWQRDNPFDRHGVNPRPPDSGSPDAPAADASPDAPRADASQVCVHPKVKASCGAPDTSGTIWCAVPAGCFVMGAETTDALLKPGETRHQVTLTHPFEVARTEVTQGQFKWLLGYNPSYFATGGGGTDCGMTCPVEKVSWHEAAAYCNAVSVKASKTPCYACSGSGASVSCQEEATFAGSKIYDCPGYRLPTEAEWEYAYRAGTTTQLYNGDIASVYVKDVNADKIGWYELNSNKLPHPAGLKDANGWGLHDLAGNVFEWCHDRYLSDLGKSAQVDPVSAGSEGVVRGGSWDKIIDAMRGASRCLAFQHSCPDPTTRTEYVGFRCVRTTKP